MLAELNIRNFAIIDELKVDFDRGLTVISGETGAGKSIIVGAVVGRWLITRIPRPVFEWTILLVALASGTYLMFS